MRSRPGAPLGAQVIAVSVAGVVLLLAAVVQRQVATAGIAAMAVTAAAVAATPGPMRRATTAIRIKGQRTPRRCLTFLVERLINARLTFGAMVTRSTCGAASAAPVPMRCPTPVNWPEVWRRKAMDARGLDGLRLDAASPARPRSPLLRPHDHLDGAPYDNFLDARAFRINVAVDHGVVTRTVFTG